MEARGSRPPLCRIAITEVEQRVIRGAARHQQAGLPWRGQGLIRSPTDPSVESEPGDDTERSLVRWESRNSLRRPRRGRGWAPEAQTAEAGVLLDRLPHGLRSRPQRRVVPTDWARTGANDPDPGRALSGPGASARRRARHAQHRRLPDSRSARRAPGLPRRLTRTITWAPRPGRA